MSSGFPPESSQLCTRPRLYLGKAKEATRHAVAMFGLGITSVTKTRSVWLAFCLVIFCKKKTFWSARQVCYGWVNG